MEVILFGDLKAAVITHLKAQLVARNDTATVTDTGYRPKATERRPDNLVVVTLGGGQRRDLVTDSANIEFECFAPTDSAALARAQLVRGIVNALPGSTISGITVYRVQDYASPAMLPHPLSGNPRYVYTARIDFRGSAE